MPIRSMTGFAQVKGEIRSHADGHASPPRSVLASGQSNGHLAFALSLKAVNHRFLDLHFRLPSGSDSLEMQLRRLLKEKIARGHVEVTLNLERGNSETFALNRPLVSAYIAAFRAAAGEFSVPAEPDLNAILRIPGALDAPSDPEDGALESAVMATAGEALDRLNQMREQEGRSIEHELRQRMTHLGEAVKTVQLHRRAVLHTYVEKLQTRLQELLGSNADRERAMQEAALLVDRSDIQEEIVRLENHVQHFLGLLDADGEVGKKLDFLLQEMNREANTLLSKTSGLAGEALKITEAGLVMKAEIEKSREQVQNLE
ncbi:MAG TPA: YicC/YloC family endoribonuclease [Candidatus Eremiobacteraceae bacterium]|nr:YicC/YloC family endoribonuclease [Candidatus Eremiobacteraceae bacterium]